MDIPPDDLGSGYLPADSMSEVFSTSWNNGRNSSVSPRLPTETQSGSNTGTELLFTSQTANTPVNTNSGTPTELTPSSQTGSGTAHGYSTGEGVSNLAGVASSMSTLETTSYPAAIFSTDSGHISNDTSTSPISVNTDSQAEPMHNNISTSSPAQNISTETMAHNVSVPPAHWHVISTDPAAHNDTPSAPALVSTSDPVTLVQHAHTDIYTSPVTVTSEHVAGDVSSYASTEWDAFFHESTTMIMDAYTVPGSRFPDGDASVSRPPSYGKTKV